MTNFFNKKNSQDTLYFDGLCPMCTKEIDLLRRLNNGGLSFVDIHECSLELLVPSKVDMLKVLHLMTADGNWLTGAPASVKAWSHTHWGWIFKPLLWPFFSLLVDYIYKIWAARRYSRLYDCDVCSGVDE